MISTTASNTANTNTNTNTNTTNLFKNAVFKAEIDSLCLYMLEEKQLELKSRMDESIILLEKTKAGNGDSVIMSKAHRKRTILVLEEQIKDIQTKLSVLASRIIQVQESWGLVCASCNKIFLNFNHASVEEIKCKNCVDRFFSLNLQV